MRKTGGVRRDLERETAEVQTEWSNGLSAKTVRRSVRPSDLIPGRALGGRVLVTRLAARRREAGVISWFPDSRVLVWNLPGSPEGFIASEHLKDYGNWPLHAGHGVVGTFRSRPSISSKRKSTGTASSPGAEPGWSGRVMQFFSPTLSANEPGCDGLHCSSTERSSASVATRSRSRYAKLGCSYRSWWRILDSWRCDFCNAWVVECFFDGGVNWDDRLDQPIAAPHRGPRRSVPPWVGPSARMGEIHAPVSKSFALGRWRSSRRTTSNRRFWRQWF